MKIKAPASDNPQSVDEGLPGGDSGRPPSSGRRFSFSEYSSRRRPDRHLDCIEIFNLAGRIIIDDDL